jgi:predicted transcriptional regulator
LKQEKRHKLQLHYEILCAIDDSRMTYQIVRPTNIQPICRLAYNKLINHLIYMEQKGMIHRDMENNGSITLTQKGKMFIKQYKKLVNLIDSTGL